MCWLEAKHRNPSIPSDTQPGMGVDDDGCVLVRIPFIPNSNPYVPNPGFGRWIDVPLVADGVTVRVGHARMAALLEELARDGWPTTLVRVDRVRMSMELYELEFGSATATTPPPPDDEPPPPRPR